MKLELGGGRQPLGLDKGWVNVDVIETADVIHNLNSSPWPFEDNTIDAVYSAHCLQFLDNPHLLFDEICRICIETASVELRVPHPASQLAMAHGHKFVHPPLTAINMEKYFGGLFWKQPKRMRLTGTTYAPTILLDEARAELPFLGGVSNEAIMRWIPGTCHECIFHYVVVKNEFLK